jgi:hypothetical protein
MEKIPTTEIIRMASKYGVLGGWYKARDVEQALAEKDKEIERLKKERADLARRVLENLDLTHLEDCPALYGNQCLCGLETMKAELEQLAKGGEDDNMS